MRPASALLPLILAACATPAAPPPAPPPPPPLSVETADYLWLGEGPCFGFCPSYRLTLTPGGYTLLSERVTSGPDRASNAPDEGSFEEAQAVLVENGFADLPDDITPENREACPNPATDLPTAWIMIGNDEGYWRQVTYYQGCFHPEADAVVEGLRQVMHVRDLVDFGPPAD